MKDTRYVICIEIKAISGLGNNVAKSELLEVGEFLYSGDGG